jgi:hypothetical protein
MPYCPHCGKEIPEETRYCEYCGEAIIEHIEESEQRGLVEHIKSGIGFSAKNPIIFLPEALAGLWNIAMIWLIVKISEMYDFESWYNEFYPEYMSVAYPIQDYDVLPPEIGQFMLILFALLIIWFSVSGILTFASVHMIWGIKKYDEASIGGSIGYVFSRFGKLFLAALIGNILAFTMILIPAVYYMYAAMVIDSTGIREGLSRGFSVSMKRLGASVVLIILFYIARTLVDYVPYVSDILTAVPATITTVILMDIYLSSK